MPDAVFPSRRDEAAAPASSALLRLPLTGETLRVRSLSVVTGGCRDAAEGARGAPSDPVNLELGHAARRR